MIRNSALVVSVLLIGLLACPALAKDAASQPTTSKDDVLAGPHYQNMIKECDLSKSQVAQLREKVQARNEALAAWDQTENGQKLQELQAALKQARSDKDQQKIKDLRAEMKPLRAEKRKLFGKQQAEMMSILKPEQIAKWRGYQLYVRMCHLFAPAKLTDEQKAKVKDLAQAAVADMSSKAENEDMVDKQAGDLFGKIRATVLTDEQREMMKKTPQPASTSAPA